MSEKKQRTFTDAFIRGLKPKAKPYKRSENAARGEGRLIVRVLPSGTKEFFYRYRVDGGDKTLAQGRYDPEGRNGKTLAGIRKALSESRAQQRETGDVKGFRAIEEGREATAKRRGSLEQLLTAYVDHLKARKSPSATEAEGIFRRNVVGGTLPNGKKTAATFPTLAQTKAADIGPGDIQRILAKMVKAGLTRQVNKARSYLGAAFAFGGKADNDPRTMAKDGVLFALGTGDKKVNPVLLVPVIREYEKAGDRVLSEDELREYWKALDDLPTVQEATLKFNLALACQRPSQLLRAGWPEFDFAEDTLLLKDSKGRGGSRDHLLPLTDFALDQLKPLRALNEKPAEKGKVPPPPFSSDGKRGMSPGTLSHAVEDISKALLKHKKIPVFQLRDLRRTAETMLQKMGVDKEVRAHLLSHGRSAGVQGKHYERYNFLDEKRAALEKWARHLERITTGKSATVTPIRAA